MPMIPDDEIERIKRETDLAAVIRSRGVELKPQGGDLIGLCPFHSDDFWKRLQKESPKEFEDACQFDDAIRTNACRKGKREADIFLHRSLKPLRSVKFDDGNMELFGNECEGHCGL